MNIRETAKAAQIRWTLISVWRSLLSKSTPVRGQFPVGAYVYFFKTQQQPGTSRVYRWFGPARVIGVELCNPRRLEDEDVATEGSAPHSYWLRYGPTVVLTTGEQMRFASEDELLAAHTRCPTTQLPICSSVVPSPLWMRGHLDFRRSNHLHQSQPSSSPSTSTTSQWSSTTRAADRQCRSAPSTQR